MTVWQLVMLPTNQNGDPWDWDGSIPDDLLNALGLLDDAVSDLIGSGVIPPTSEAMTAQQLISLANDIAQLTDEYAPQLLSSTVPPDIYLDAYYNWAGGFEQHSYVDTISDRYDPEFATTLLDVEVFDGEVFSIDAYDEDLFDDDYASGFDFTKEEFQDLVGCGPWGFVGGRRHPIQVMQIEVEAAPN